MRTHLALLAATLVMSSGTVQAAPASDYEVTYFREREMKTEVGWFYKPCGNGAAKLRGTRTPYFVKSQSKCGISGHGIGGGTLSCRFTQAGCTDAIVARLFPIRRTAGAR